MYLRKSGIALAASGVMRYKGGYMLKQLIYWLYIKFYNYHISKYEHDINTDCDYYGCKECDGGMCKGSFYFGDKLPW